VEILEMTACCRFVALAKTRAQRRYPQRSRQARNAGQRQKRRNPTGARQKGVLAESLFVAARCGDCASLAFATALLPLRAAIPVFSTSSSSEFSRVFSHRCFSVSFVADQIILKRAMSCGDAGSATLFVSLAAMGIAQCLSFFSPLGMPPKVNLVIFFVSR